MSSDKPRKVQRARERGFTFVEILVSSVVLSIVILAAVTYQTSSHHANNKLKDRAFATQKAIQMMEELRSYVNGGLETSIDVLDGYDDGAVVNGILSTDKKVIDPGDALSANVHFNGGWKFVRKVSVRRLAEAPNARWVQVRVYYANGGDITHETESLAEVTSILKTVGNISVPTQSMDLYILALENVPGWWSSLATLRPMFDNSITDLENRNPGLEIRRHWITRLAYGRDPYYTPYVNLAANASTGPINDLYFYPGMLNTATNSKYYEPANIRGRFKQDGTVLNAASATDPYTGYTTTPYSLADHFNHGLRYPEELSRYNSAVALDPTLEPSLRILLEDMNSNPAKYTNALVVNLHGEMLPLPPMHNFSDPAKDPRLSSAGGQPYLRAVTHPERLYYAGGDSVALRVYTYLSNPGAAGVPATAHAFVVLKNVATTVTVDSVLHLDAADSVWVNNPGNVATTGSDIVIDLPASQTSRGLLGTNRGLPSAKRLYGMDYVPTPIFGNFTRDLRYISSTRPKNTAEWRIKLHYSGSGKLTVETRIGDPVLNTPWSDYPNLSRTYAWIGTSQPPVTERYQFMGDPRHSPYADVFGYFGYNWYFAAVDTNDYNKMYNTRNGWGSGTSTLDLDLPRYSSMWRGAMLKSNALWTNMTGFSFYYIGTGGEMGADASNGYPNGLPISGEPWNLVGSQFVDEITSGAIVTNNKIPAKVDLSWYAKPWLGEIYPDNQFTVGSGAGWDTKGNLPTGSINFYRAPYNFAGSPFSYQRQHRANNPGCASLFNGKGTGGGTGPFRHEYRDNDVANILSDGLNLSGRFNLGLPSSISASRPFTLNYNSSWPAEWNDTAYVNTRSTTSIFHGFYDAPYSASYRSSASVRVAQGGQTAYFMMNGLSPQTSSGSAWMARYALVSMVQTFMDAGDPAYSNAIAQLPRVQIVTPDPNDDITDPSSLSVTWNTDWKRWDLQTYNIPGYTPTAVTMHYVLKYSRDGGRTWAYADDNSSAEAGFRLQDSGGTDLHTVSQPFSWNVSAMARGSYLLRLEGYRAGTRLHYAYHQAQIYIKRTAS